MKYRIEDYTLGDTDETVLVERSDEHALASLKMVQQSSRSLEIISPELDPVIYNTPEFADAVKQLALKGKYVKVRILVREPLKIVKRGHRLVDLSMLLTSYIEIRVPGLEHASYHDSVLIADTTGYIHRVNPDRYEGKLNFNDKRTSRIMLHQFDEMWGKSRPDPNLKRALL